jgi:hypothetical protein
MSNTNPARLRSAVSTCPFALCRLPLMLAALGAGAVITDAR